MFGGDIWILRIVCEKRLAKVVIPAETIEDYRNGSYQATFSDFGLLASQYTTNRVEVFLERSAESVEAIRYMTGGFSTLNRRFAVKLKLLDGTLQRVIFRIST